MTANQRLIQYRTCRTTPLRLEVFLRESLALAVDSWKRRTAVRQGTGEEEAGAGVAAAARKLTAATAVVLSRTAVAVGQAVAGWTAETAWGRSVALETAALA